MFCVQLLDILSSFVAVWRSRIVRFLLELFQKSGCSAGFKLQFLCHGVLCNGDLFHTIDLLDLPTKLCEKRQIKSRISCDFLRIFLLRIFNISQKVAKFDSESDFQMSSFSSNPDKNNRTRKIGLSHPGSSSSATPQDYFSSSDSEDEHYNEYYLSSAFRQHEEALREGQICYFCQKSGCLI